ncbi:DNA polymerase [Mycoplana sp. BE70]|nr:DNA polymerase [Mycoplana sp. BE70]
MPDLREQASGCHRCDLYKAATQLVFGEGAQGASVVLVGEQPGDREDIAGRPFVGPAGLLLNECLHEAGVDRSRCYVTNAVKHFKFQQRGKRRLHAKPNADEIQRCAWWLAAELDLIHPRLVVALGGTALYTLFGRSVSVTKARGQILQVPTGPPVLVTVHPSYLLRTQKRPDAEMVRHQFVTDLHQIVQFCTEA